MIDWDLSDYDLGRLMMVIDLSGFFCSIANHGGYAPRFEFRRKYRDGLVQEFAEFLNVRMTSLRGGRKQVTKTGIDVIRLAYLAHSHVSQQRQEQIHDMLIGCREFIERCAVGFAGHGDEGWRQLEPRVAKWARRMSQ